MCAAGHAVKVACEHFWKPRELYFWSRARYLSLGEGRFPRRPGRAPLFHPLLGADPGTAGGVRGAAGQRWTSALVCGGEAWTWGPEGGEGRGGRGPQRARRARPRLSFGGDHPRCPAPLTPPAPLPEHSSCTALPFHPCPWPALGLPLLCPFVVSINLTRFGLD